MEYKLHARTGRHLLLEPTVGRSDYQGEIAILTSVTIRLVAYANLTGVFLAAPILTLAEGVLGWVLRLSQADVIFPDKGTYSTLVAATAALSATASAVWCACVFLVCQAGGRIPSEKFGRQRAATEGA